MNEKILEEFEKIIFVTGPVIVCPSCNTAYSFVGYGIDLSCKNEGCNGVVEPPSLRYKKEVKSFLTNKLNQARVEERERVVGEIRAKTKGVRDSLLIYFHNAVSDQKAPYRHAIQAIEEELLYSTRADYFKKKI